MNHNAGKNWTQNFQKVLGIGFKRAEYLEQALTHKSFAVEKGIDAHNERLEFLGDAVLSLAAGLYLFNKYPDTDEGTLSKLKSTAVSRKMLFNWSQKYDIARYVRISESEELTGGRKKESILSNTMEAVIGAIFIDSGFETSKKFIFENLDSKEIVIEDFKSQLQEIVQCEYKTVPHYDIIASAGPEHAKLFKILVSINKKVMGTGIGKNKKEAQQAAACEALKKIYNHDKPC
ncbi:MAG: Ribonuclease 3 [Elusimicrobia bacterium ADurb.Bin231]|nr:MAG: Ribonuclease 3 [Elusimicrobia bacterium ADurb.Bin231]